MIFTRGTRDKIDKYCDINQLITLKMQIQGPAVYDFCCFGVDKDNKLSDDRYMVFYNQINSPNNEITYKEIPAGAEFYVQLNNIPDTIQKLVFTGSIDGNGKMSDISSHKISIEQNGQKIIEAEFNGSDFQKEKAITSIEVYRKNGWRFNIVARGFDGGLDKLLSFYGGEQADSLNNVTINNEINVKHEDNKREVKSAAQKVPLEKKIQEGAPKLISLVKPLKVELEKRNLQNIVARVALVLDKSGSMDDSYEDGTVQEIVNKILPIAVQFDDNGDLDFWIYADEAERRPSVNMQNYETAVSSTQKGFFKSIFSSFGIGNNEPVVMKEVIDEYKNSDLPAYIIFITDGGIYKTEEIKRLLIEASKLPIFWQFVGVRGSNYGILEHLDTMESRYIDNANFFALDDFKSVSNSELYSRLLNEFPTWLKEIKTKNII